METRTQFETKISEAEAKLDADRRRIRNIQDKMRDARTRRDLAVLAFQNGNAPVSRIEVLRDHIDAAQREKLKNVSEGRRADDPGNRAVPQFSSNLDAYRSGGKGPAGVSGNLGRRPGEFAASNRGRKLPSER